MQTDDKDYPVQSDVYTIIIREPVCFAAKDPFKVIQGDIPLAINTGGPKSSIEICFCK